MTFANDIPSFSCAYRGLPNVAVQPADVNEQTATDRISVGFAA